MTVFTIQISSKESMGMICLRAKHNKVKKVLKNINFLSLWSHFWDHFDFQYVRKMTYNALIVNKLQSERMTTNRIVFSTNKILMRVGFDVSYSSRNYKKNPRHCIYELYFREKTLISLINNPPDFRKLVPQIYKFYCSGN